MRVAIVSPEFPPDIGGIETYAWEFTRELVSRGHQVTVFTSRHSQGEVDIPGVEVRPVLRCRRRLDSLAMARHQADVWHVMNAAYAWLALEGKHTVVSVHGNDFLRPYLSVAMPDLRLLPGGWRLAGVEPGWLRALGAWRTFRLMQRALPRAHHVMANSRYTEQSLLEQNPACAGRTSVAWVGVGPHFFDVARRPASDGVKRLITVCRLSEPRKNVDKVLQALAQLKPTYAFVYTVVGDGHDRRRLEALARDLGLAERVRFAGFVDRKALTDLYAEADLLLMASSIIPGSHEGFGIAYIEAAACGVPSLAARLAGAVEAVSDGASGVFVDEPDVASIVAKLKQFLDGSLKFDADRCRAFARQFTYARVVDHALQRYGVGADG
jgi:phosphatidyl-myo-inositol dimannoside synthase